MQQQGGSDSEEPSGASAAAQGLNGGAAGAAQASAAAAAASSSAGSGDAAAPEGGNGSGGNGNGASATPVADSMRRKLTAELEPLRLEIIDNSHQHAGHAGAQGQDIATQCRPAWWQCLVFLQAGIRLAARTAAPPPSSSGLCDTPTHPTCMLARPPSPPPPTTTPHHTTHPTLLRSPAPPPAGYKGSAGYSGETHFTVEVVSPAFDGLTSIKRHRLVYGILAEELRSPVHALSLITKTPAEAGMA